MDETAVFTTRDGFRFAVWPFSDEMAAKFGAPLVLIISKGISTIAVIPLSKESAEELEQVFFVALSKINSDADNPHCPDCSGPLPPPTQETLQRIFGGVPRSGANLLNQPDLHRHD